MSGLIVERRPIVWQSTAARLGLWDTQSNQLHHMHVIVFYHIENKLGAGWCLFHMATDRFHPSGKRYLPPSRMRFRNVRGVTERVRIQSIIGRAMRSGRTRTSNPAAAAMML